MLETLALYSLLTTALFYLGSRAKITSFLWSRYPPAFARFMDCAACSGFWWGLILAFASVNQPELLPVLALPHKVWVPFVIGLAMIVLTPITAGLMQRGLDVLGTIEQQDEQDE